MIAQTFEFFSNLKHFRYALHLRQYSGMLQKALDRGSLGLTKDENERMIIVALELAKSESEEIVSLAIRRAHLERIPSQQEL